MVRRNIRHGRLCRSYSITHGRALTETLMVVLAVSELSVLPQISMNARSYQVSARVETASTLLEASSASARKATTSARRPASVKVSCMDTFKLLALFRTQLLLASFITFILS